jgi:hypothetical protein
MNEFLHKLIRVEQDDPEDLETVIRFIATICFLIFHLTVTIYFAYYVLDFPEPEWWIELEKAILKN